MTDEMNYEQWFESVFRKHVPVPGVRIATSWDSNSKWGQRAHCALINVEVEYVKELLREIKDKNIEGDIAEFGIFEGWWINFFWEACREVGLDRRIYGFDSFSGLSDPDPEFDADFWKKGQYSCSLDQVINNVQAHLRPNIHLIKGYFEHSLQSERARALGKLSYVRIDCDIYRPAIDCLRYLSHRLSDGAILVFDDWPHTRNLGEQKAFEEWLPQVPHLEFEFLFYNTFGHFYLRVHHK